MLMTFDFVLTAKYNTNFMKQLKEALSCNLDREICADIHRLNFYTESQTIIITPKSKTSTFHDKIVPKKITYQALEKMINEEWDNIDQNEITDI